MTTPTPRKGTAASTDPEPPKSRPRAPSNAMSSRSAMAYDDLTRGMGAGFPAPRRGGGMTAVISPVSPAPDTVRTTPDVGCTVQTCQVRTGPCSNNSSTGQPSNWPRDLTQHQGSTLEVPPSTTTGAAAPTTMRILKDDDKTDAIPFKGAAHCSPRHGAHTPQCYPGLSLEL